MSQVMVEEKKENLGFLDLCFLVLMAITSYYTRNILCQVMMVVFCGTIGAMAIVKPLSKIRTFYFVGNALFVLYGFIGTKNGIAISPSVATTMVVSLALNLIMVYAICQYISWKDDVRSVIKLFEWSIFVAAIMTLVKSGGSLFSGRLGSGTEINANMLAMLSVYAMTVCMYLMKDSGRTWIYKLKIVFYVAIILLSGSRKGLLMIVVSVMLINVIRGKKRLIRNILMGTAVAAVLYLIIMNVPVLYNIIGTRVEDLLSLVFEDSTADYSLINRQRLIDIGWGYIQEKPWIGHGYDNFKLISDITGAGQYDLYSHNNYIELLFGGGIIGTALYYIPMAGILIGLIRNIKTHPCITYLLAIFIAKHMVEYAYVSYYERIDAYIVAIILGCLLWCRNKKIEENKELRGERV